MAENDPQRQIRENTLELQEFLKDLKGWEEKVKENERTLKSRTLAANTETDNKVSKPRRHAPVNIDSGDGKETPVLDRSVKTGGRAKKNNPDPAPASASGHTYEYFRDKWDKFDVDAALREVDEEGEANTKQPRKELVPVRGSRSKVQDSKISPGASKAKTAMTTTNASGATVRLGRGPMTERFSSALGIREPPPDAISEKDLGNDYFKEAKYVLAIDCYSRSIALKPTAVAYANRAMAELKIRRFEDAERDCSEAISLDDRYVKAYSRRGTARKQLKTYLLAIEDFEFALRLEPESRELRKQYSEVKDLYEMEARVRPSQAKIPIIIQGVEEENTSSTPLLPRLDRISDISSGSVSHKQSSVLSSTSSMPREQLPNIQTALISELKPSSKVVEQQVRGKERKVPEVMDSTQAATARAAAAAMAVVSRNVVAPRTSYEFETSWKAFARDRSAQARLLQVMDPASFPSVFKDSLVAPLLLEIIKTLEMFFPEHAVSAVAILDNLKNVGRFSMSMMFLSSKDRSGLSELWEKVFLNAQVPQDLQGRLKVLRALYRIP